MILDKKELFYQKVNSLGLIIPKVDGFQYGYRLTDDALIYEKWVNGSWRFAVSVGIETITQYQGRADDFSRDMNKTFAEEYAKSVTENLINPNDKKGGWVLHA